MENKDISQIALEKIRKSGLKPISKNVFNIKRVIFWSLVGTSIIVGALSFSVILLVLFNNEWYLYDRLGFNFIFKSLPYFWFVFLAIFTIMGDFYYRRTLLGYRHRTITIVGVYVVFTIILGSVLHVVGIGNIIEESLSKNIPVYRGFMFDKSEIWSHPEKGLLSGEITDVEGDIIKVLDLNGDIWILNVGGSFVGKKVNLRQGETIKIIGDIDEDNIFTVEQVRPWIGNGNKNNMMR